MRVAFFLLALMSFLGFSSCGSSKHESRSESISSKGNTVTVSLKSNPTTGFSWSCEIQDANIAQVNSESYSQDKAPKGLVGVGGLQTFVLKCTGKGKTAVKFTYRRPWEGGETDTVRNAELTVDEKLHGTFAFIDED